MSETATLPARTKRDSSREHARETQVAPGPLTPKEIRQRPDGTIEVVMSNGEIQTNGQINDDMFYVPKHVIPDGMTYEYKAVTVMGNGELAQQSLYHQTNWRPVHHEMHPGVFGGPGSKGSIVKEGLMLMCRAAVFTDMARRQDKQRFDNEMVSRRASFETAATKALEASTPNAIKPKITSTVTGIPDYARSGGGTKTFAVE